MKTSTASMLYFDHSASTPPHPDVIRTMTEVMEQIYANPSSIHHMGGQAEQLVRRAREVVAGALNASPNDVIFTSGATESNNLAILGTVGALAGGRSRHIITSAVEHASVYECFRELEREGTAVTYLPVDEHGRIRPEDLEAAIRPETALISLMHVNNETGSVQPLAEAGRIVREHPGIVFHVDGVQGLGKLPVDLEGWGVHLYSLSGHKIRGPKGVGALLRRGQTPLKPLFAGGAQEHRLRPGTVNVPGVIALSKAVRLAVEEQQANYERWSELRGLLLSRLEEWDPLVLNSPPLPLAAPHIVNLSFPGMKSEVVVHALEELGIIVSTQSACSSKLHQPSRVLMAMTNDTERAASGLRISMGADTDAASIERLSDALAEVTKRLAPMRTSRR